MNEIPTLKTGRHKNEPITRVPVSYLRWMVNINHDQGVEAEEELKRRGSILPTMEISGHALDRASQRLLSVWLETREGQEGLYTWLLKKAQKALKEGAVEEAHTRIVDGVRFVFEMDNKWPVIKSVMLNRKFGENDPD